MRQPVWSHIGSHKSDTKPWKEGCNDRECRKYGRIAHFIHSENRSAQVYPVELEMAMNVSTTTIASSTSMPMEKIKAKRVTLLRV